MIYLFHGDDRFRRDRAVLALKKELVDPAWETTNLVEIENPSAQAFEELVSSPPFGMGERLVIISNPKFLVNKGDEKDVERILSALDNLPDNVTVLFSADKIMGTIKLVKSLKKISELEDFKAFADWDTKPAATWLAKVAKEKDLKVNSSDLEIMVEYLGADSSKLYNELIRLSTLSKTISKDLIQKECRAKSDVFKFAQALAVGERSVAQMELNKLIRSGEANIGFLIGLQTNVGRYLKLKLLTKSRLSQDEQAKKLSVTSGRLYYLKKEVERMDLPRLEKICSSLTDIERKIKTGKRSIDTALKLLLAS